MGSHDGVVPWLHCTRRQVGSEYNSELGSPTSASHLLFPQPLLPSTAVVHPPVFFFESYASFSLFARPGAVPVTLSLLPLLFRSSLSWADGSKAAPSKEYNRTAEENGWVLGTYAEEDSIQLTKDEAVKRYKQNQQAALDRWVM